FVCWPCTMPVSRHSCEDPNFILYLLHLLQPLHLLHLLRISFTISFKVESFESIDYAKMKEIKEIFRENKILYSNQNQMTQSLGHRGTEARRHRGTEARRHGDTEGKIFHNIIELSGVMSTRNLCGVCACCPFGALPLCHSFPGKRGSGEGRKAETPNWAWGMWRKMVTFAAENGYSRGKIAGLQSCLPYLNGTINLYANGKKNDHRRADAVARRFGRQQCPGFPGRPG
ncbi:MAG: hypothetical protein IJQ38_00520, partial [Bacteroidaceae bacterium]|nr:hypothetical protein [Bacteroidaceae bacterium]